MGRAALLWVVSTAAFVCITTSLASAGIRPQTDLAYTDPGSGAMIIQLLTTFALMAAFYLSRARQWVAKRLGLGGSSPETDADGRSSKNDPGQS